MQRSIFVTEGPHDVEVIAALLSRYAIQRVKLLSDLDSFWKRFVPTRFPHDDDLLKRVPVPLFLKSEQFQVAIISANGIENIARAVSVMWMQCYSEEPIHGIGVLLDSDDKPPHDVWSELLEKMRSVQDDPQNALSFPDVLGDISASTSPRLGGYVLPNCKDKGTLESLLLQSARVVYPKLLSGASQWIDTIHSGDKEIFSNKEERRHFAKPSGKDKAKIASMASVLRPGRAIQNSLQDNRWFKDSKALALPDVTLLQTFIAGIVGVSASP